MTAARGRLAALGCAVSLLAGPAFGAVDLASYRARLERIASHLRRDRPAAAEAADRLLDEEIDWNGELLEPDPAVLEPIADHPDTALRGPLDQLIAALPREGGQGAAASADLAALAALKARQEAAEPGKDGALPGSPVPKTSIAERILDAVMTAMGWIADRAQELWNWLKRLFPDSKPNPDGSAAINPVVFALVGVIVVVVVALAIRAARRGGAPVTVRPSRPRAADADADPLSRSRSEWEDRARALAAEGRSREAIRAWYHALLVASFRSGALHHRRGRTNWEYARALGEVGWREPFLELTGRFDLEWYGRAESTPEALDSFAAQAQRVLSALQGPA